MKTPKINISKLLNQIDSFGEDAQRLAVAITNSTADDMVADAYQKAPVDLGQLRLSIGHTTARVGYNKSFFFANAPYSAYVEFGTGGKVRIPSGFEELASRYKGKGIREVNINPQPFFIPAYLQNIPIYQKKLVTALARETKKYNAKK
jgi:HK97 gp10 family phage protein